MPWRRVRQRCTRRMQLRTAFTWRWRSGLTQALGSASPVFHPAVASKLQEELERQAVALEEDICHLRTLIAADRKRPIKDFWRRHAKDIVQGLNAVQQVIQVESWSASGL